MTVIPIKHADLRPGAWIDLKLLRLSVLLIGLGGLLSAQFGYPTSASTQLIFPQLADGGDPSQRWMTTLMIANPNRRTAATVKLSFHGGDGQALPLNFGGGASPTLSVEIPAGGIRILTSAGDSVSEAPGGFVVGWARASSNTPVLGTVLYRAIVNGTPSLEVAAPGVGQAYFFTSPAKVSLGVALANPSLTESVILQLTPTTHDGESLESARLILPPSGHSSFVLGQLLDDLPADFSGSIQITSLNTPPVAFAAWTLYERDGLLAPLPSGETRNPAPYGRRLADVTSLVKDASAGLALALGPSLYGVAPDTVIDYISRQSVVVEGRDPIVSAKYMEADDSLYLSHAMVEMLASSDSGMAFLVGHYVAKAVLSRTGIPSAGIGASPSIETSSDALSLAAILLAGHDPGGVADLFGRLAGAKAQGLTIDPEVLLEFGPLEESAARLAKIWQKVIQGCADSAEFGLICQKAKNYWQQPYSVKLP